MNTKWINRSLLILHEFIALSAIAGGYFLLSAKGLIKQSNWLQIVYYIADISILISVMLLLKYKKGLAE